MDIVDTARSPPWATAPPSPRPSPWWPPCRAPTYDTGIDLDLLNEIAKHFRERGRHACKADGFLDPKVLKVDINTLLYQVPGGMLSNLISQLKQAGADDKLLRRAGGGAARAQGLRLSAAGHAHQPDRGHPGRA